MDIYGYMKFMAVYAGGGKPGQYVCLILVGISRVGCGVRWVGHTRKKGKINKDSMAYVWQWQWRSRQSRDCVLRATARQLQKQVNM